MRKVRSSCRLTRRRGDDAGVAAIVRAVHGPEVGAAATMVVADSGGNGRVFLDD